MKKTDTPEEVIEEAIEAVEGPDFEALAQRAAADLENMRKRFDDERKIISKFAIGELVLDLLPVLDNFTRATEHVPEDQLSTPWMQGITYIRKQLLDTLTSRGVSEITTQVGDAFDPMLHEAIGTVEGEKSDTVAEVKATGYKLYERVIRPAQVIVTQ